eukprot:3317617-Rhodomonas_salina.1
MSVPRVGRRLSQLYPLPLRTQHPVLTSRTRAYGGSRVIGPPRHAGVRSASVKLVRGWLQGQGKVRKAGETAAETETETERDRRTDRQTVTRQTQDRQNETDRQTERQTKAECGWCRCSGRCAGVECERVPAAARYRTPAPPICHALTVPTSCVLLLSAMRCPVPAFTDRRMPCRCSPGWCVTCAMQQQRTLSLRPCPSHPPAPGTTLYSDHSRKTSRFAPTVAKPQKFTAHVGAGGF